jgi:hypothetical protein
MTKFVFETLGLTLALFVGGWLVLHFGDKFAFHTVGAQVVGSLPQGHPDLERHCRGILYSASEPIDYRINSRGELVLRCPLRLFPIVQRVVVEKPPQDLIDKIQQDHRNLITK